MINRHTKQGNSKYLGILLEDDLESFMFVHQIFVLISQVLHTHSVKKIRKRLINIICVIFFVNDLQTIDNLPVLEP